MSTVVLEESMTAARSAGKHARRDNKPRTPPKDLPPEFAAEWLAGWDMQHKFEWQKACIEAASNAESPAWIDDCSSRKITWPERPVGT